MEENEPKIRFSEFKDNWKEYKLGEVTEKYKELIPTPADGYWRLGVRSHAKGTFLAYVPSGKQLGESELSKVLPDNLIFNIVFAWEHAVAITKEGDEKALVSHRFPQFTFHDNMVPDFFRYEILDERFKHHLWLASPSGAGRNKTLIVDEALEYKLYIPEKKEQEKIASYLLCLDEVIKLHQNKYNKLVILKNNMLSKMFPNCSEVPEIRFNEFEDKWDFHKLGSIGDTYTGLSGKTKEDFGHGEGRFITYTNVFANAISNPLLTEKIELDSNQVEVKKGDVFFTTSSEIPNEVGMSSVLVDNVKNVYLNSFCFGYRPKIEIDNYYFAYMLRSVSIRKKIAFLAQGISRYNISKNKVMEIEVPIPKIDEQQKIGAYFRNLDELILAQQHKIEKLYVIRKSCLENMLI